MSQPPRIARPLYIWRPLPIITPSSSTTHLLTTCTRIGITDLFIYLDASHYQPHNLALRTFNSQANNHGIRVWALEGGRIYFSDADGPSHFYRNIDALVAFNAHPEVLKEESFHGFAADLEPYTKIPGRSSAEEPAFHPGRATSQLSNQPGTGVWKSSEAEDRSALLSEWVQIHTLAREKLHAAGLQFSSAFPHWMERYCGEALQIPSHGSNRSVMELLMENVDVYVAMSYSTDPKIAARRCWDAMEGARRRLRQGMKSTRVLAAVEMTKGVGKGVSYGDEVGKASREVVVRDVEAICGELGSYEAFGGVAMHAWEGWCELPE